MQQTTVTVDETMVRALNPPTWVAKCHHEEWYNTVLAHPKATYAGVIAIMQAKAKKGGWGPLTA